VLSASPRCSSCRPSPRSEESRPAVANRLCRRPTIEWCWRAFSRSRGGGARWASPATWASWRTAIGVVLPAPPRRGRSWPAWPQPLSHKAGFDTRTRTGIPSLGAACRRDRQAHRRSRASNATPLAEYSEPLDRVLRSPCGGQSLPESGVAVTHAELPATVHGRTAEA
jgi:hypothetical protein